MSTLSGGADDLIRWTLNINEYIIDARVYGSRSPIMMRERDPDADLTLHSVDKEECEAIIALINEMRSRNQSISAPPVKSGNRFAGLEFE